MGDAIEIKEIETVEQLIAVLKSYHGNNDDEKEQALASLTRLPNPVHRCILSDNLRRANFSEYSVKMALELPFVSVPQQQKGKSQANSNTSKMSCDTSVVDRMPAREAYKSNIVFQPWNDCFQGNQAPPVPEKKQAMSQRLLENALHDMINRSISGYEENENPQLMYFKSSIVSLLQVFGFDMHVHAAHDPDFTCTFWEVESESEKNIRILIGEGKDEKKLPQKLLANGFSPQLCTFGFASWLVSMYVCKAQDNDENHIIALKTEAERLREELKVKLKLTNRACSNNATPTTGKIEIGPAESGSYSGALKKLVAHLENSNSDLSVAIANVLSNLGDGKVSSKDALSLWAAVMQACLPTIRASKIFTIVLSVKFMWFIKLEVAGGDQCQIRISDPVAVGSPGSNLKLFNFLDRSRAKGNKNEMSSQDRKEWEKQFPSPKQKDGSNDVLVGDGNEAESDESQTKKQKLEDGNGGAGNDAGSNSAGCFVQREKEMDEGMGELVEEQDDDYMDQDMHGVVIPYFHQIEDVVKDLGTGRCGIVKQIKWKGGWAALKTYEMNPDGSDRSSVEAYERERDILFELEPLWGKQVPRLLFHKYWPCKPVIGLQLGEPMPLDWSEWEEDEIQQAKEAVALVEEQGWIHGDVEPRNFVRLSYKDGDSYVALIDFEGATARVEGN